MTGASYCPNCGEDLTEYGDPTYCPACGEELTIPAADPDPSEGSGTTDDVAEDDFLRPVREERAAVEEIAERDDRLGATAGVLLALADDEEPATDDLAEAGLFDPCVQIKDHD